MNKYFYEALINNEGEGKSMWDRIVEQIEELVSLVIFLVAIEHN